MSAERPVAIVTGSSSGVGAATAKLLAGAGWHVVINYTRKAEAAEAVAAACREASGEPMVKRADVAEDADCRALAAAAMERWGRIDALVNNAGTTTFCDHADLEGLSADDFHRIYAVNTVGAFQMTRAVAPAMQDRGRGSIVNTASIAGLTGVGSSVAYAASKGALITMTKSLARALGPAIRVNAVCPGFIKGEWLREGLGKMRYRKMVKSLESKAPLQQVCEPDDVADAIYYFIAHAKLVTGETLLLDGGANLGK